MRSRAIYRYTATFYFSNRGNVLPVLKREREKGRKKGRKQKRRQRAACRRIKAPPPSSTRLSSHRITVASLLTTNNDRFRGILRFEDFLPARPTLVKYHVRVIKSFARDSRFRYESRTFTTFSRLLTGVQRHENGSRRSITGIRVRIERGTKLWRKVGRENGLLLSSREIRRERSTSL